MPSTAPSRPAATVENGAWSLVARGLTALTTTLLVALLLSGAVVGVEPWPDTGPARSATLVIPDTHGATGTTGTTGATGATAPYGGAYLRLHVATDGSGAGPAVPVSCARCTDDGGPTHCDSAHGQALPGTAPQLDGGPAPGHGRSCDPHDVPSTPGLGASEATPRAPDLHTLQRLRV